MSLYKIMFVCAALILAPLYTAKAEESTESAPSPIEITNPYAFATMPGATTGAAFMIITNTGETDDRLIAASSRVSKITEIHENLIDPDDGMMMMRKIKALDIPAGKSVTLEPKGYHIMFIKMKEPLAMGGTADFKLTLEKAGDITVSAKVIAPGMKPKAEKIMPWETE